MHKIKLTSLGLSVAMVGMTLGSFGAGASPAGAAVSAFDTAVAKVTANQVLTSADVTALKDQVRKVMPNTTDQFFNVAFYMYTQGQPQYVQSLPATSTTETVPDPAQVVGGGALSVVDTKTVAASGCDGPYDGYWVGGFTVTRKFFSLLGYRLASFSTHAEAGDAHGCIYPQPPNQDTNVDVTGNGSYGGWYFDRYNDVRGAFVKYNGRSTGEYAWTAQALFRQCVVGYCNAWDPKIAQQRYAAGPNIDADWQTDESPDHHWMDIGIRVA